MRQEGESRDECVTRFAPSPTGALHIGHAYSAMRAHDLARANGGRFLLRIEDIDPGRSREAHVAAIIEDLAWLGLVWDGPVVRQSQRYPVYAAALDRLRALDLLYPCFCTRAEIAASASAPHAAVPVYPGTCRSLSGATRGGRKAAEPHAWRLDIERAVDVTGELHWHDAIRGWIAATPLDQGDIVLARKDAPVSYHLAATIDDAAFGISDVVRGVDLFEATHVHRLLQALLGLPTPRYHHHPLLAGSDGARLAKRSGAPRLAELRARGADPVALLARLRDSSDGIGFVAANS